MRDEGFLVSVVPDVVVRPADGAEVPSLAAEAWVGAVIEDGSRTGLVGDLARVLLLGGDDLDAS